MYDLILVRYGEMTLKKKNYHIFLKQINDNIKRKLKGIPNLVFSSARHRFYIYLNGEDHNPIIEKLDTVFGLSSYSLGIKCEANYEAIAKKAIELIKKEKNKEICTFKVETNRSDKSFPATSLEISKEIANRVLPLVTGLVVDIHKPELMLNIDLRQEGTFIYLNSIKGLGGFPSGVSGKALLMLSGGIDSPVAGFLGMKKGIEITALHFASPPYTSDQSLQKVIDLAHKLLKFTQFGKLKLIVCPFTKIQKAIYDNINEAYGITIMRRHMYRIADILCKRYDLDVIINGESIGQVASQTLESMKVINDVTNLPVIRPLVTYDKVEIMKISKMIGTYEISTLPYEDCCTIFVPKRPIIKPKLYKVEAQENQYDFDKLINEAVLNVEFFELNEFEKRTIYEKMKNTGKFEI